MHRCHAGGRPIKTASTWSASLAGKPQARRRLSLFPDLEWGDREIRALDQVEEKDIDTFFEILLCRKCRLQAWLNRGSFCATFFEHDMERKRQNRRVMLLFWSTLRFLRRVPASATEVSLLRLRNDVDCRKGMMIKPEPYHRWTEMLIFQTESNPRVFPFRQLCLSIVSFRCSA